MKENDKIHGETHRAAREKDEQAQERRALLREKNKRPPVIKAGLLTLKTRVFTQISRSPAKTSTRMHDKTHYLSVAGISSICCLSCTRSLLCPIHPAPSASCNNRCGENK